MKNLFSFIMEYKGHAIRDKEKSIGDPDEIKHYFDSGWVHLKFNKDNAYPYVYNKKLNKIIFGKPNTIHNNIFSSENEKELKEMGLENVTKIGQIRYCCGEDDDTEEIDKWYEENKQYVDNTICGRLWYDAQDDFESWDSEEQAEQMAAIFGKLKEFDSCKCYVVNWNEIEPNEFQNINDNIVKLFADQHSKKIKSYIAIDNNGEPIEMFVGENVKVEKRSSEREKEMSKLMDIHNPQHGESWEEFRKRKREATKGYNKARGEHFQRDYYNQTKSKTAAEWHNNKTKRYNPRTGKMEWGEKIGDSLQMKSLKNYINEQLITEHFVNCKNEEEMRKYGDVVWSILKKAYEYCGGIKNVESVDDLIKDTHLWKLYRKDDEIKAVICYTDRKGGRKMCLLGQDGSDDGRKMLKKMMEDDFKLKDRKSWVGVSGKAAITALKHGGIPVPSEVAINFMGSKCKPYDEYWYNRPIKGADGKIENHLKIMVGNPPGHESVEVPQELIDKLIKQAAEFGE